MSRVFAGRRSYMGVLGLVVGLVLMFVAGGPGGVGDDEPEQAEMADPSGARNNTAAQLDTFYATYGGRAAFSEAHREVIEAQLYAEDEMARGDYGTARRRLDEVFAKYPLSHGPSWNNIRDINGTFTGGNNPTAYAGLRMLDEAARVRTGSRAAADTPLRMTVVVPDCAETDGVNRPIRTDLYNQNVANDYHYLRQAVQVFRHYVYALTDGARDLEVEFINPAMCAQVSSGVDKVGLADYPQHATELPDAVQARSDMYWIVTPLPAEVSAFAGGMGWTGDEKPMFLSDQLTTVAFSQQARTEVERRLFFPAWFQHEFSHYLFLVPFKEFNLEYGTGHNWFDPNHWPADFQGHRPWEADFFIDALHRRMRGASPGVAERLKKSDTQHHWTQCTTEGGRCSFSGTQTVRYGAPGQYEYFTATDGTLCLNSAFNRDPAPNKLKTCALQSSGPEQIADPGGHWQQCTTEGGRCSFSGTITLRYGVAGQYEYFTVTDGTLCLNSAFNRDPAPNKPKTCALQTSQPPVALPATSG